MSKHRCPTHPEKKLVSPSYSPYSPYKQCPVCGVKVCLQCGTTEDVSPLSGICSKCYDQNLKSDLQRDIDRRIELLRIEREHGEMVSLLKQVGVVMGAAAASGVARDLDPQSQADWARVHMAVQDLITKIGGEQV